MSCNKPQGKLTGYRCIYPEIPNDIIADNITSFCKLISPIRSIHLGMKTKELSHVMSSRRQVHVIIAINVTIPDHINCIYGGVNYRISISTESVKCFNCGETGHISKTCKKLMSMIKITPKLLKPQLRKIL